MIDSEQPHASSIVAPIKDLDAVLEVLGARRVSWQRVAPASLETPPGRFVCVVVGERMHVKGHELGMGAAAQSASRRFGWALSFHPNPKRGVILASRYEQGEEVRGVSEIESELSQEGLLTGRSRRSASASTLPPCSRSRVLGVQSRSTHCCRPRWFSRSTRC